MAFERIEGPLEPVRSDIRAAVIASVIANVNRDEKTRPQPFTPNDFMPKWEGHEQTTEEQIQMVTMLNDLYGGKDERA